MDRRALNILVIDDNPDDFVRVKTFLHEQSELSTVKHARDFRSAIRKLSEPDIQFDVILLDTTLSDKAGEPLIEAVVQACPGVPVIVLTGCADFAFSVKSLSLGAADYLLKDGLTPLSLYKSIVYSSERRRQSNELANSQLKYSELFHLSPLPIWVFDLNTLRFLDVNDSAVRHYGYSRKEFLNMTIFDIRPPSEIAMVNKIIRDHRAAKYFIKQGIFLHQKKSGELIQVDIQSNSVTYQGREAKIILANDITERLNYIKEIETQNKTLKDISWMQSHIIRAPLSRIMGLVPLIEELKSRMDDCPGEMNVMLEYLMISALELDQGIKDIVNKIHIDNDEE
jgi:PAS domain S-box-containing protein